MSNKKYKGIKTDSLIAIKVSGGFYADMKTAFFEYLHEGETQESAQVILNNIQNKKITTPKEKVCFIMMTMMAQIEVDAQDQGLVVDFDPPSEADPQS